MTFNQFNLMSFSELSAHIFNGVEICVDVSKALNFRRYLVENFPDMVEKIDFSSFGDFVYIKKI